MKKVRCCTCCGFCLYDSLLFFIMFLSSSYPKFDLLPFFICRSRFSYVSAFKIYPKIYLHSLYILSRIKSLAGFPNELDADFPLFICTISHAPTTFYYLLFIFLASF